MDCNTGKEIKKHKELKMDEYLKEDDGDDGLNKLLKENASNHSGFWNQVLLILVFLGVQSVILKEPEKHIYPRIQPIDENRDKSTQQFIGYGKLHWEGRKEEGKDSEIEEENHKLAENFSKILKSPNQKSPGRGKEIENNLPHSLFREERNLWRKQKTDRKFRVLKLQNVLFRGSRKKGFQILIQQ